MQRLLDVAADGAARSPAPVNGGRRRRGMDLGEEQRTRGGVERAQEFGETAERARMRFGRGVDRAAAGRFGEDRVHERARVEE